MVSPSSLRESMMSSECSAAILKSSKSALSVTKYSFRVCKEGEDKCEIQEKSLKLNERKRFGRVTLHRGREQNNNPSPILEWRSLTTSKQTYRQVIDASAYKVRRLHTLLSDSNNHDA